MQSFPFTFEGKDYEFQRLTKKVKDYVTDRMTAERISRLTRLVSEGLIEEKDYVLAKSNANVRWGSPEFGNDIATPEYGYMLIRQLLVGGDKIDDETLERMTEDAGFQSALQLCHEDSEPKKKKGA